MGETLSPENLCTSWKRATEELINGRDSATQLQILFQKPTGDRGPVSAEELVVKISTSFSEALSLLMSSCGEGCQVCRIPATTQVGSPSCGDRRSVDSGESSKRPAAAKDRRGSYKRRKTSGSWMKVSPTVEDGHAWRKYGQKVILNAKFPRCYFRCTHKHDQGCLATKQVQIIQDSPHRLYQSTYFGHHTCASYTTLAPSQHPLLESHDPVESSAFLLSFESNTPKKQEQTPYPSCPPSIIKEEAECKEETVQSNNSGDLPALQSIVWGDLMPLESSSVYSSASTGSHGLEDMDFLIDSVDFENTDFHFGEEGEFL